MLQDHAGCSSAFENTEVPGHDECVIPLVVLSASGPKEDAPTGKEDDECKEDCESFYPTDLMSFAWQIARGMVNKTFIKTNLAYFFFIFDFIISSQTFFC